MGTKCGTSRAGVFPADEVEDKRRCSVASQARLQSRHEQSRYLLYMIPGQATHQRDEEGVPAVLRFEARLFQCPEASEAGYKALLDVPGWVSKQFAASGAIPSATKVEGVMNGQPFRAVLEPDASGGCQLHVNKAMRKGAGAEAGDTVQLAILGPQPEPTLPADFRDALVDVREAQALWRELTLLGRLDWIRWIESARKPATRARRIARAVEQLAEGKRRPCCVNVYEFMLKRIQADDSAGKA